MNRKSPAPALPKPNQSPAQHGALKATKKARKEDALALAHLVYEVFQESKRDKIIKGQNDANNTTHH